MLAGFKIQIKTIFSVSTFVCILLVTSFASSVAQMNFIPTGSMNPTVMPGDLLFVNKMAYDIKLPYTTIHLYEFDNPKRNDIIIFYNPYDGRRFLKRVIGVPGDKIGDIALANDEYFVMGDNRDNSFDSRYFGPVKRKDILGKAVAVVGSLRIDRFFMGLI